MKSRIDGYEKASRFLESLTEAELKEFLDRSTKLGSGTGGEVLSSNIDGLPVFIKKIRLTDLERRHFRSTENLFELPCCYQYGVGSQGFGVWREIASHEMTTKWVLEGECQNFPLMYHFRVLERENLTQQELSLEEREEIDSMVQYWDQSIAVKEKLMAARQAQADVVVVMESLPKTLNTWMKSTENLSKLKKLECELNLVIAFMQSKGFLHLDAHFHNILSNNDHPYFADFGLALCKEFELSSQEKAFLETHKDYDRSYVAGALALETLALCTGERFEEEQDLYLSSGKTNIQLPPEAHEITARYQKFAKIMGDFLKNLREHW
jgi:hypothetical protein